MRIVSTLQSPTSVSHSLCCRLSSNTSKLFLVVAKISLLEVYLVSARGLVLQCTTEVWGRIVDLKEVRSSPKNQVLILTDHPNPTLCLLDYLDTSPGLKQIATLHIHDCARPTESFNGILVAKVQSDNIAFVSTYVGRLKAVKIKDSCFDTNYETDLIISDPDIRSMCFVQHPNQSETLLLAILHRDPKKLKSTALKLYCVNTPTRSPKIIQKASFNVFEDSGMECNYYVYPSSPNDGQNDFGGIIVIGGAEILRIPIFKGSSKTHEYIFRKATARLAWSYSTVAAVAQVDEVNPRYIIGDDFGRLALLAHVNSSFRLVSLGEASSPTTISHLSSQYFFVGSHFGNSQVIRLEAQQTQSGKVFIDVVDHLTNIAPVMDAIILDYDSNGQPQFVTCSGGNNTGSLRLIRHGAYYVERSRVTNVLNVQRIWSLGKSYNERHQSLLLVSTPIASHILSVPSRSPSATLSAAVVDITGFDSDLPTISAANFVERTRPNEAKPSIYDASSPYFIQNEWKPEGARNMIVAADISPSQVCIGLSTGEIVLLGILNGNLLPMKPRDGENRSYEISSVAFAKPDSSKHATTYSSKYVVIGEWNPCRVSCYSIPSLERISTLDLLSLPSSLLMQRNNGVSYLYIGHADGTISLCNLSKGQIVPMTTVPLGRSPISLCTYAIESAEVVVAVGDQTALLKPRDERLDLTPILTKGCTSATSMKQAIGGDLLVLSTNDSLVFGRMPELNKLHIQEVPMGLDNPCKIAHDPTGRILGVACTIRQPCPVGENEVVKGGFKLLDASSFRTIGEYRLDTTELPTALALIKGESEESNSCLFALGTTIHEEGEYEASKGRITLFLPSSNEMSTIPRRRPIPVVKENVNGCVFSIAGLKDTIIVTVNAMVYLYSVVFSGDNEISLHKVSVLSNSYLATNVVTLGEDVLIGDAMHSVTLLRKDQKELKTVSRCHTALWPVSMEFNGKHDLIIANCDGDLYSMNVEQGRALESSGAYHLDEIVNKFLSVDHTSNSPTSYAFTSTGRICVITRARNDISILLSKLQRNMANSSKGIGCSDHNTWRSPTVVGQGREKTPASGFLDGDFLESFRSYSEDIRQEVLDGKNEFERLRGEERRIQDCLEEVRQLH